MVGASFDTIYRYPLAGSTAAVPQLAPPPTPGIVTVPFMLGGVNRPSLREFRIRSRQVACSASGMYGLTSFSVSACLAKGGGLLGKGCVGHACSPGTSDFGTGRSSIGHNGCPVTRSSTKRNPCLVG